MTSIGHNNPPDPIDAICAEFEATRLEAENWLDGTEVQNEGQMKAVDALRAQARDWRLSLERGQKSESAPLYDTYKAALERWKPTIEDAKRIEAGLVAAQDGFKRRLAAEKAEAQKKAWAEAEAARKAAQEAAEEAAVTDLAAQRAAAEAQRQAEEAQARLAAASADKVKGMRTVWRHEVTDHKALINWIVLNDRAAMVAFIEQYAAAHYRQGPIGGVRSWQEKEAF